MQLALQIDAPHFFYEFTRVNFLSLKIGIKRND